MSESASDEYIIVIDNAGRRKRQKVEYIVLDVRREKVYVTAEGLKYTRDSLRAKGRQRFLLDELERIPNILAHPDIVVWDYEYPDDTLIYYKRLYIKSKGAHYLIAAIVKIRQGKRFLYNVHVQESGKVKGYHRDMLPEVWYINPRRRPHHFGL